MKKFNLHSKMNLYILSSVFAVFAIVLIIIIIQTAGKAVEELNTVTQSNTSASEELASNSEEMEAQAEQLKEIVSFFQIKE